MSLCFLIFANIFTVKKIVSLETDLIVNAINEMMKIFEYEKNCQKDRKDNNKDDNNDLYSKNLLLTSFFKMLFNCMANDAFYRLVEKIDAKDIFNYTTNTILKIDPKEASLHFF